MFTVASPAPREHSRCQQSVPMLIAGAKGGIEPALSHDASAFPRAAGIEAIGIPRSVWDRGAYVALRVISSDRRKQSSEGHDDDGR